ncbi:MAG: hypothetical protein ACJAVX_000591 [Pseudoalteromonas rhizosphaerae]|jgi:hypothetical protein|uniref:DUF2878 domain-containing protein n=1 Tax=Pseudoalteromonas neustonica TaxID=1840331 RepID=A0ABY3FF54_9GAMM|nr:MULTISPECIES: DUF2878 domain-containing protein [Pseudoalteromonas]MBB1293480.1 DUF2878 domain-containing protein [Pseudoalteromonas sp. SR41-4]MBB1505089.1 DUF2878 domain-containing protein [Pseudoalteromonas sp. SG41-1]MBB1309798.1 DUF2878 domain-containing protein [Pseudoalteromonas sp. SR41-8]MBB1396417.1 DUF2878 domain-containing protein [Pseudoalteromonas sp. SG44-8]TVU84211.1 DUF2878 domain-containing protein [Pseudoalteromonas neustonica]|tara:strand:- start:4799 stop:5311 length:513 start_codon:yes stop_codon:yes gene_type:complete
MTLRSVINFLLFQGVWFLALFLEQRAIIPILLIIILMLCLSQQKQQDMLLLCYGLMISLSFEYLMVEVGFLSFSISPFPLWFILLWCALLLTINTSMQFLHRTPWYLAMLLCAVFAPASYIAGARFGALEVHPVVWQFWLIYGFAWSLMFNFIRMINTYSKKYLLVSEHK